MKKSCALILASAAAAAVAVPLFLVAPGKTSDEKKSPFMGLNVAHRGLHSKDKTVPENSLEAFRLASEAGYGIELDVQLSKDGRVVVFHDDNLKRVCGVEKRVDELDYQELSALSLCGSEQRIPLFAEVLKLVDGRSPLIVELKKGRRNRELCEKTCSLLRGYKGEYCIESFDPRIVAWFRRKAPEILRGQLANTMADYKGEVSSPLLSFALSRCLLNVIARPQFIAYSLKKRPLLVRICELMGAMKVCWTSHEVKNEKGRDTVIFEFYNPSVRFK